MGLLSFVLMWDTKSEQDVVMNIVVKKYGTIERDYSQIILILLQLSSQMKNIAL